MNGRSKKCSSRRVIAFEQLESRRTPAVTWQVRFDDYGGGHAAYYAPIRDTLLTAANEWGRYLAKSKASIQLAVRFDDLGDNTIANASSQSSAFFRQSGKMEIWEMSVPHEIRTGKDINAKRVDAVIRIDSESLRDDWWFDPTPANRYDEQIPANKLDAYSILQHELGHILGFTGWRDWTTGIPSANDLSRFDPFVFIDSDGTPYFTGKNARSANGGNPVPLTYSNLYHVGNDTHGHGRGSGRPGRTPRPQSRPFLTKHWTKTAASKSYFRLAMPRRGLSRCKFPSPPISRTYSPRAVWWPQAKEAHARSGCSPPMTKAGKPRSQSPLATAAARKPSSFK